MGKTPEPPTQAEATTVAENKAGGAVEVVEAEVEEGEDVVVHHRVHLEALLQVHSGMHADAAEGRLSEDQRGSGWVEGSSRHKDHIRILERDSERLDVSEAKFRLHGWR